MILRHEGKLYVSARQLVTFTLATVVAVLFLALGIKYAAYLISLHRSYQLSKAYYNLDISFLEFKQKYEDTQTTTLFKDQKIVSDYYRRRYYLPEVTGHGLGFRQAVPDPATTGDKIVVLCIGSSTVEQGFPDELRRLLEALQPGRFEVVNAGIPGATMLNLFMNYATLWRELSPDIVIIEQNVDDVVWNPIRPFDLQSGFAEPCSTAAADTVQRGGSSIIQSLAWLTQSLDRYGLAGGVRLTDANPEGIKKYGTLLESLVLLTRGSSATPILVTYQPAFSDDQLRGDFSPSTYDRFTSYYEGLFLGLTVQGAVRTVDANNEAMRDVATRNRVPLVETEGLIPRKDEYFVDGTHHSASGNALVARAILDVLQSEGLVERPSQGAVGDESTADGVAIP